MQTISAAEKTATARKYDVFYGTTDQAVLYVDDAVYAAHCGQQKCESLLTYAECKAFGKPVQRGEKSVAVRAYVRKVRSYDDPITGELVTEVHKSARTIALFPR